ncbi:MAG: phosphotransferase [Aeromonadales bacterium]|nr:phosphotransferase [Aeromonadales bacterium]MDY2890643.1 phosphotransferase [Succinivibrio sp.]
MTDRKALLSEFAASCGIAPDALSPLGGDASFRRYYRAGGFIISDSPPDTQKNREFYEIDEALGARGIRVPKILKADLAHGFFLQEDLGDTSFAKAVSGDGAEPLYKKAIDLACTLAASEIPGLPPFDDDFVKTEFGIFTKWWLSERHGIALSKSDLCLLDGVLKFFQQICKTQPQVPMHRDFHSRNIMVKDGQLCLIDFQDMVRGPLCYDCASLIFDCYVKLDAGLARRLESRFFNEAAKAGLCGSWSFEDFRHHLLGTSLQRHVKVLGIFSRLHLRDGKDGYLKDLPRVLEYSISESEELGLSGFASFLKRCAEAPCAR